MNAVINPKNFGRLAIPGTVFFLCDVQERFRGMIHCYEHVILTSQFLVKAAKVLDVPCVVTEQYPKGLLHTVKEIDVTGLPVYEKTKFSMLTPEVEKHLATLQGRKTAVLFGIETHVCVYQTTLDLLEKGWDVHIVADGVSSTKSFNREMALRRLEQSGAWITSAESVLFDLMKDKNFEKFKEISNLVKEQNGFLAKLDSHL